MCCSASRKRKLAERIFKMNLDVRINRLIPGDGNIRAVASANFDGCFAVKNIKVMEGSKGLFVSMPSYKAQDGSYKDICFPTTPEFRQQLSNEIIGAYHQTISQRLQINFRNYALWNDFL